MQERRSNFDYEDLLACGRGELFVEGPQLPLPPMLMFDRISEIAEVGGEYGKGLVRAVLDLKPDLWFFPCHFKGDPVMPGCLGLDALWQMLGFFLGWLGSPGKGRALGLGELKFSGQVLPTVRQVIYGIDVKRVMRSKLVLGIADGWLKADGSIIYRAMERNPKNRYATARAFASDLQQQEMVGVAERPELHNWKDRRTPWGNPLFA